MAMIMNEHFFLRTLQRECHLVLEKKSIKMAFRLLTEGPTHDKALVQIISYCKRSSNDVETRMGSKRICPNCNARFYDMHRQPIICPKCSNTFDPEALLKSVEGALLLRKTEDPPLPAGLEEMFDLELQREARLPLDERTVPP